MLKFGSFAVGRKGEPAAALGKRLEYFARPAKGFDRSLDQDQEPAASCLQPGSRSV